MSGAHAAVALRDLGCFVSVLGATGGRGGCSRPEMHWSLGPRPESDRFIGFVEREMFRSPRAPYDAVLALTEPIQRRLWELELPWRHLLWPRADERVRVLLGSKQRLAEAVRAAGIPVPEQISIDEPEALDRAIETLGLPLVLKGDRGRGGNATYIARTERCAHRVTRRLARCAEGPGCAAQRYVRGVTCLAGGVFAAGRPLQLYLGEKLALHPAETGPSVRLRSFRDEALVDAVRRVFELLAWTGLASADFIRDDQGRFFFLEVNPRPWGSIAAAAANGVDLFTPFLRLLAGDAAHAGSEAVASIPAGRESIVFPLCLLSAAHWRRATQTRTGMRGALAELRADLAGPEGAPWRDPRQAVHLAHRLARATWNW
jgi:hypothetical protein